MITIKKELGELFMLHFVESMVDWVQSRAKGRRKVYYTYGKIEAFPNVLQVEGIQNGVWCVATIKEKINTRRP